MKKFKNLLIFLALAAALVGLQKILPIKEGFVNLTGYFREGGLLGIFLFLVIFVVLNTLFFPTALLLVTAGAAFGLFRGYLVCTVAMNITMLVTYYLGNLFFQTILREKLAANPFLARILAAIQLKGIPNIFLLRMSPMISFILLNYLVALIKIPMPKYLLASTLGLIFPVLTYIYLGTIGFDFLAPEGGPSSLPLWLKWGGLGITLAVTFLVSYLTRQALKKELAEPKN